MSSGTWAALARSPLHGEYGEELNYYVNVAGIGARDVIRWATQHGAELVGRGDELGVLKPGALADILVVDGDPLADIGVLRNRSNLLAILKDGAFVKNDLNTCSAAKRAISQ